MRAPDRGNSNALASGCVLVLLAGAVVAGINIALWLL